MSTTETPGPWINNPAIIAELNDLYNCKETNDWECRVATYMRRQAAILLEEANTTQIEEAD